MSPGPREVTGQQVLSPLRPPVQRGLGARMKNRMKEWARALTGYVLVDLARKEEGTSGKLPQRQLLGEG